LQQQLLDAVDQHRKEQQLDDLVHPRRVGCSTRSFVRGVVELEDAAEEDCPTSPEGGGVEDCEGREEGDEGELRSFRSRREKTRDRCSLGLIQLFMMENLRRVNERGGSESQRRRRWKQERERTKSRDSRLTSQHESSSTPEPLPKRHERSS